MKKALLGLSIIAILSPAVASAQDFYVGASVGGTKFDVSDAEKADLAAFGVSVDDDDTGFKVFAGYRAHENFAFEAFYVDLGEVSLTDGVDSINIESDSFGISALGIIPLSQDFELFGKIGFHAWEADLSSTVGLSGSTDDTDPTYGVGAAFTMDQVSFRAEIERFELNDADIDMISAGVTLNF